MQKQSIILLCILLIGMSLFAQANSQNITIQRNTNFQSAIRILENLSLQFDRRNIVNLSSYNGGIPIQINNLPWNEALHLIVNTLDLQIESRPGAFIITDIAGELAPQIAETIDINQKMVKIHATFFYADRTFLNSLGIDWSTLVDGQVSGRVDLTALGSVSEQLAISGGYSFNSGRYTIGIDALFRFFESNQKGSVLARPTVTVLSGREGYVQVGQDFSLKTLDDTGNTIDEFYSTGIILTVRPTIIEEDDFEAIYLEASIENSSVVPAEASTVINKNQARTDVILFDKEEIALAGLIDTDMTKDRGGIPFLKDLPWWVFGLRYLFGYESTRQVSREMVVVLRTELVSPARDRIFERQQIRDSMRNMREEFDRMDEEIRGE